ncbi:MAG: spore coat protein [Firmicutes bacterium]|nr:spore coat protein [Bacillota bacterium]
MTTDNRPNPMNFKDIGSKNANYTGTSNYSADDEENETASNLEAAQDMVSLDDESIATDVLTTQKGLCKMYGTAITEVSCPNLRNLLHNQFSECADDQFHTFQYMNENGMYETEDAGTEKMDEAKQTFAEKEKETFNK